MGRASPHGHAQVHAGDVMPIIKFNLADTPNGNGNGFELADNELGARADTAKGNVDQLIEPKPENDPITPKDEAMVKSAAFILLTDPQPQEAPSITKLSAPDGKPASTHQIDFGDESK